MNPNEIEKPEDDSQKVCAFLSRFNGLENDINTISPNDLQQSDPLNSVVYNTQICAKIIDIAAGNFIPTTAEDIKAMLAHIFHFNKLIVPVSAILVAQARRTFVKEAIVWAAWAKEATGFEGSVLHHRRKIGDMLIDIKEIKKEIFTRLIPLPEDKLITLTRITTSHLPQFLAVNNIDKLTRDELREAVSQWLGETPEPKKNRQGFLPGFESLLDTVSQADEEQVITFVQSADTAVKALSAGKRILSSAIVYYYSQQDIIKLHEIKKEIQAEMLSDLEQIIASMANA